MDLPLAASPESCGFSSQRLERVKALQQRLVDDELLPFTQVAIGRHGRVCYSETVGMQDVKKQIPAQPDTICRLFSMTKPIASMALMTLYEEGRFLLTDPLHLYLGPAWQRANMSVYKSGGVDDYESVKCTKTMTIHHVLTHTSGLSYGFDAKGKVNMVDAIYAKRGIYDRYGETTLADFVERLPTFPLLFQPGSSWTYGFNIDVCGRLCEVISGMPIAEFIRQRITVPLRMKDTSFVVPEDQRQRFSRVYKRKGAASSMYNENPGQGRGNKGLADITDSIDWGGQYTAKWKTHMCGSGLTGSISDYSRFCQMCLQGGELDGARIVSRKTMDWMTVNHLESDRDMKQVQQAGIAPGYAETGQSGVGFGLGFSVVVEPAKTRQINSVGTFAWGGAASTIFWIDPAEDLFVVFISQFMYRDDMLMPLRAWLGQLVYGALCDAPDPSSRSKTLPWRSSLAVSSKL